MNLNKIQASETYGEIEELNNNSTNYSTETKEVNVYFRNLKENLIKHIRQHNMIIGCVAWLTDFDILDELSKKETFIIVQKEDFLRPDSNVKNINSWKNKLQRKYNSIGNNLSRYSFENDLSYMSQCGDDTVDSIMCVGNHNLDKDPAFPRMHNKFIITCECKENYNTCPSINPIGVWTGSFNFTYNANQSLENALYISNKEIVKAYYNEFGHIASMAEFLNWENEWCTPEWRIGS